MKIRIHYREGHSGPWINRIVEAPQMPAVGEYLAPAPVEVFRVVLTLYVAFEADYDGEVFAERVEFETIQEESLGEIVWNG